MYLVCVKTLKVLGVKGGGRKNGAFEDLEERDAHDIISGRI